MRSPLLDAFRNEDNRIFARQSEISYPPKHDLCRMSQREMLDTGSQPPTSEELFDRQSESFAFIRIKPATTLGCYGHLMLILNFCFSALANSAHVCSGALLLIVVLSLGCTVPNL